MTSPTQRSIALLEDDGWDVERTEHVWRIPDEQRRPGMPPMRRKDFRGFGDLHALKVGAMPLIVQTTDASSVHHRLAKILADPKVAPRAKLCLLTGHRIVIHGWRKLKRSINRKHWHAIIREVTLADFDEDAKARAAAAARAAEEEAAAFVESQRP